MLNKRKGERALRSLAIWLLTTCWLCVGVSQAATLEIPGTGASQLLVRDLAKDFEQRNPGVRIVVPHTVGSRGGIRALLSGKSKIARISRPLKPQEKKAGVQAIFFAISPVVFICHPSVETVNNLSAGDIVSVYSGEVRNWEILDGPSRKIYPVTRDSGSVLSVVRKNISNFPDAGLPIAKPVASIVDMVKTVEAHPFSMGFSTQNLARSHDVKILDFDGVSPSDANVISGRYPISLRLGLALMEPNDPTVNRFVEYLFTDDAAQIMRRHGAVPLQSS